MLLTLEVNSRLTDELNSLMLFLEAILISLFPHQMSHSVSFLDSNVLLSLCDNLAIHYLRRHYDTYGQSNKECHISDVALQIEPVEYTGQQCQMSCIWSSYKSPMKSTTTCL